MLFGREPQMALLGDTLREVAGGTGRVVAIVGEAGIGKTHLVSALAELGRARGLDVAVGRCFAEAHADREQEQLTRRPAAREGQRSVEDSHG